MTRLIDYRYDECGLDNVILKDLAVVTDDAGDDTITIPNINDLHCLLVCAIARKDSGMSPAELRFVRTEMGLTQAQLAELVGRDAQSVGRWERGEKPMEQAIEMIVRLRAMEHVGVEHDLSLEEIAKRTMQTAVQPPILIDAHDPTHYQLAA